MKILDVTSFVTGSVYQPGKAPSINFIENAYQETSLWNASAEILNLNNASQVFPNQPYAMYGCFAFYVSPHYIVNSGVILYQGILYNVNAADVITLTPGFMCATFSVTNSGALDPTEFSDGSFHNVHNDTSISWFHSASASALTPGALFDTTQINYLVPTPQQIINYNTTIAATISIIRSAITTINSEITTLTSVTATASWSNLTLSTGWGITSGFDATYTKDGTGRVYLSANLTFTGTTSNATIATLPTGYIPNYSKFYSCYGIIGGVVKLVGIRIFGITSISPGKIDIPDTSEIITGLSNVDFGSIPPFLNY